MTNEPSLTPHAIDPSWGLGEIATRFNRPLTPLKVFPRDIRPGSIETRAAKPEVAEKLQAIRVGLASTELGNKSRKLDPKDTIDFDAPVGMEAGLSDLKLKAATLPTEGVFLPIVSGFGKLDRAAIDPWRTFITVTSGLANNQGFSRGLDRGISL